jgi:predicted amidohydrolase YtcJ
LTVPLTVADVGPTALTGPVIAVGAAAIAAAPATTQSSAEAVKSVAMPRLLRIRGAFRAVVKTVLGEWKGSVRARLSAVILENGVVRTLDPSLPAGRALAIAGAYVAGGVGVHETALASPDVVNLGGRCVLPVFTDSHVHFPTWSLAQRQVKLDGCASIEEALARVRDAEVAPGRWLRGYGWRDGDWQPRVEPTKEMLDEVTGDTPTILISKDYHSAWLNSAALAVAGGDLAVHGGVVERDASGEPTGILREESAWRFRDRYVLTTEEEWVEATRVGLKLANSRGVGAIHDKDGWLGSPGIFQRLHDEGNLSLRVWGSIPHEQLDAAGALSLRSGFGDEYLRIGYLKCFMDGTLGSRTALMTDGSGVEITSRAELEEIIRRGAERGWPIGVHAIGDQANRNALDAFEATRTDWEPKGLRHRIEHAQCLAPEDVTRFAGLGIACSVQFSHAPSDRDLADRLWADRLEGTYSFRSLLESGALVANGSDAPVEELDPIAGVAAGVLRSIDDRPAWRPEETLSIEQALHATCVAPTFLSGDERRRGRLLPGLLADLVVLDRDPFAIEPEELRELQVVATMVGGRWVHNPPPWD